MTTDRHEPEFYTPKELASLLRFHVVTVYAMIREGKISPVVRVGRTYRIPASTVTRLREGQGCR